MKKSKKSKDTGLLLKLMIACVVLSIVMLGIVAYDKIIKKPCNCESSYKCVNK